MHVSAVWQLMPKPPARVDIRKTNFDEPTMLNALMSTVRCTRFVEPSRRQYLWPRYRRSSSNRSRVEVNCENRTTRWR